MKTVTATDMEAVRERFAIKRNVPVHTVKLHLWADPFTGLVWDAIGDAELTMDSIAYWVQSHGHGDDDGDYECDDCWNWGEGED